MNLLAGLILLIGGYKIYEKLSTPLPEDEESPPPAAAAAPAAQPSQPAPAPIAPAATPAAAATPAVATQSVAAAGPTIGTTTTESGAVFPTLATGAMPEPPPTFSSGQATGGAAAIAPTFLATTAPGGAPAPAFPGGGGAAAPAPAFPGGGGAQPFGSSLQQMQPKDFVGGLPPQAQASYLSAHDKAEKEGDMMPLRSWLTLWLNQMRDPNRTLLELDLVKLLIRAQPPKQGPAARSFKEGCLRDAKARLQAMRVRRIEDPQLLEMISKAEEEINRGLSSLTTLR